MGDAKATYTASLNQSGSWFYLTVWQNQPIRFNVSVFALGAQREVMQSLRKNESRLGLT